MGFLTAVAPWVGKAVVGVSLLFPLSYTEVVQAQEQSQISESLLLEVGLNDILLTSEFRAYDVDGHIFLPLGELSRLLTIAIEAEPDIGLAHGFILRTDNKFTLNLNGSIVTLAGETSSVDPALVQARPDDIYVARNLIEQWLPLKLHLDRSSRTLHVEALEELPLQSRMKREQQGNQVRLAREQEPEYPAYHEPYRLLSMPFIDQTVSTKLSENAAGTETESRYTALLAGDFLGMEASMYFDARTDDTPADIRATFGRHDPDANLLGPLHARSFQFGNLSAPSVDNISRSSMGYGATISNRPLTQPTHFDRQTFEGDLAPGWDVELYYNGNLVAYEKAGEDGRYRFSNLPLQYGKNSFQLVFNGPFGQSRVEQRAFTLDQSLIQPGQLQYSLTEHRDEEGGARTVAQFGLGIARHLSASADYVKTMMGDVEQEFMGVGLRTFWQALNISGDLIHNQDGGKLSKLALQTKVANVSLDTAHMRLDEYSSEAFPSYRDPIKKRDEIRLGTALPLIGGISLPLSIQAKQDERESGRTSTDISNRASITLFGNALTNTATWKRSVTGNERAYGDFQVSRRVRGASLRSRVGYTLYPENEVTSLALSATKPLGRGYRLSFDTDHSFKSESTRYGAGFTKSLGRYGLGLDADYADTGEMALKARFSVSMGRDSRRSDWLLDARPMTNTGAVSARLFLDENGNGLMDADEKPLEGAGFKVNGRVHQARTDQRGFAYIDHLPVKQYVAIGIDDSTLGDPNYQLLIPGRHFVPRPGAVVEMDFPVRRAPEFDATAYLSVNIENL